MRGTQNYQSLMLSTLLLLVTVGPTPGDDIVIVMTSEVRVLFRYFKIWVSLARYTYFRRGNSLHTPGICRLLRAPGGTHPFRESPCGSTLSRQHGGGGEGGGR